MKQNLLAWSMGLMTLMSFPVFGDALNDLLESKEGVATLAACRDAESSNEYTAYGEGFAYRCVASDGSLDSYGKKRKWEKTGVCETHAKNAALAKCRELSDSPDCCRIIDCCPVE